MVQLEQNSPARTIGILVAISVAIRAYLKWRNVPPPPPISTSELLSPNGFHALRAAAELQQRTDALIAPPTANSLYRWQTW